MNATPGPWRACEWTGHAATTVKAGDVVVAECSGHGRDSSESIADARLIAAAPELLEACRRALEIMVASGQFNDGDGGTIQWLSKAIAKAEGVQ